MPFKNRIRLAFKLTRPQFSKDKSTYPMADGSTKVLSVSIHKKYEGETDWMPEKWHQRLMIALEHDNVNIEGDKYLGDVVTDGDYEIDWPKFLDYPTGKAAFSVLVTPFDNSNDNCQTCEEAIQLSLEDDTFPDILEEGQIYELNVAANDKICCYPAVFSIVNMNSDYVETATLDQQGNLSVTMKSSFFTADIKLLTYRVTCPNGSYDEADVTGNAEGETPVCNAPSNIVIASVTSTTAEIDFDPAVPTPDHYYWKLYVVSFGAVLVQSGTVTTPHISLTGLTPSGGGPSNYRIDIRSQCDDTNNDDPASVFISKTFNTNPVSESCGEYIISYLNIFCGFGCNTIGAYQDCSGVVQNIFLPNYTSRAVCARQTSPGVPVYIDPGAGTYLHGNDSNCI